MMAKGQSDVAERDEQFKQIFSELANALQTAALLASRQRRELEDLALDASHLEDALDRAVRAVTRLRDTAATTAGSYSSGASESE